jgi:hypothetical protein
MASQNDSTPSTPFLKHLNTKNILEYFFIHCSSIFETGINCWEHFKLRLLAF